MTDPSEIARIAGGLTKAQRAAMLLGGGATITGNRLWAIHPALFGRIDTHAGWAWLANPTADGLAVRSYLLSQQKGECNGE